MGGAPSLGIVCVKADELCAFAVIFLLITLHLEQIKPKCLQSVTDFGRRRDSWQKGKPESFAPSSGYGTFR